MVVIEDSDTEAYHRNLCRRPICYMGMQRAHRDITGWRDRRYPMFYDRAAFIATGVNISNDVAFPGACVRYRRVPHLPLGAVAALQQHSEQPR